MYYGKIINEEVSKMGQSIGKGATASPDEMAAALIMSAAEQLVQSAMLKPALGSAVKQVIMTIQDAVSGLAEMAEKDQKINKEQ